MKKIWTTLALSALGAGLLPLWHAARPAHAQTLIETSAAAGMQGAGMANTAANGVRATQKTRTVVASQPVDDSDPGARDTAFNRSLNAAGNSPQGASVSTSSTFNGPDPSVPQAQPEPEPEKPAWRLKGTANSDGKGVAVIEYGDGRTVFLSPGDEIFPGAKVTEVEFSRVSLKQGDEVFEFRPW
jgi:hypothetical protein